MFSHYKRDINQRDNSSKACSIKKHYSRAPQHRYLTGAEQGGERRGKKNKL